MTSSLLTKPFSKISIPPNSPNAANPCAASDPILLSVDLFSVDDNKLRDGSPILIRILMELWITSRSKTSRSKTDRVGSIYLIAGYVYR